MKPMRGIRYISATRKIKKGSEPAKRLIPDIIRIISKPRTSHYITKLEHYKNRLITLGEEPEVYMECMEDMISDIKILEDRLKNKLRNDIDEIEQYIFRRYYILLRTEQEYDRTRTRIYQEDAANNEGIYSQYRISRSESDIRHILLKNLD